MRRFLFGIAVALLFGQMSARAADQTAPPKPTDAVMTALFNADQADRAGPTIDWQVVAPRDEQRRAATQALLDRGALASGDDFYHAAFIFQHGGSADDYLKAHVLATIAVARGQAEATWIAAATLDRFLMESGRSQVLGTQFKRGRDGHVTQEPYDRALLPDSVRAAMGVPSLAKQRERLAGYAAEASALGATPRIALPATSCSFPGIAELIAARHPRFLVIGEQHGTVETPATFAEIVCLASRDTPVAVAIEESEASQAAIDTFIASDGGASARAAFLADPIWNLPMKDGRSSQAMLDLFERLRLLHAAGRVTRVIAFQPNSPTEGENASNQAMATLIMRQAPPTGMTLVLTGNFHAVRTRIDRPGGSVLPMAGNLPPAETVTLDARPQGGTQWACAPGCGPMTMSREPQPHSRGLVMDTAADALFSGVLYLGVDTTASPPAVAPTIPSTPPAPRPAARSGRGRGSR